MEEVEQIDQEEEDLGSLVKLNKELQDQKKLQEKVRKISEQLKETGKEKINSTDSDSVNLIGVAFFSVWAGELFHLQSGRTIFTAVVLLSIMILPTIITLCDDAIHRVPQKYREAAKGPGLYKHEVIISSLLPIAKTDIFGAILLALGREIAESAFGSFHFNVIIFMGMILLIIVLVLTFIAQQFLKSGQKIYFSQCAGLLRELKKRYTILFVIHNIAQAKRIADYVVFVCEGKIIEHGHKEKLFSHPEKQLIVFDPEVLN